MKIFMVYTFIIVLMNFNTCYRKKEKKNMLKIIKNVKLKMSILFKERWRFRIHVHWTVADGYMYDMTVNVLFSKVDLFSA